LKADSAVLGCWDHGAVVRFRRLRGLESEVASGWRCETDTCEVVSRENSCLCRCPVLPIVVVDASSSIAEALVNTIAEIYLQAAVTAVAIGIGSLPLSELCVWASVVRRRRCYRECSQCHN
jgi:hypothetical protein